MTASTELASICIDCALCCNGALFDYVPVDEDEHERLAALGFEIAPRGSEEVFQQPCKMLAGRLCSVYAERPDTCQKFRCILLRSHQQGEIGRDEALARIATAKSLLAAVEPLIAPGETVRAAKVRWREWAKTGGAEPGSIDAKLMLGMTMLNRFLDRYFRSDDLKAMTAADADDPAAKLP